MFSPYLLTKFDQNWTSETPRGVFPSRIRVLWKIVFGVKLVCGY